MRYKACCPYRDIEALQASTLYGAGLVDNRIHLNGVIVMMYNPQLETFICVADEGSFNKASEKLFISSPAVIKQINSLENDLGLQLFVRTHRGLYLTDAGKVIYEDAKYMIDYAKKSIQKAKNSMENHDDVIRVGISPLTPPTVFTCLWPEIQKRQQNLKFQMIPFENTPENAQEILSHLGHNIDVVAGIFDERLLELRQCNGVEILKNKFCMAVSMHHSLACKSILKVEDLKNQSILMIKPGWSCYMDALRKNLEKEDLNIHIKNFDFYNLEIFNQCQNSNDMLIAIEGWEAIHPLIKLIPVDWDYKMPFGLLYARSPSQKVQNLIHTLKDCINL